MTNCRDSNIFESADGSRSRRSALVLFELGHKLLVGRVAVALRGAVAASVCHPLRRRAVGLLVDTGGGI
jgi:hypothetical protein